MTSDPFKSRFHDPAHFVARTLVARSGKPIEHVTFEADETYEECLPGVGPVEVVSDPADENWALTFRNRADGLVGWLCEANHSSESGFATIDEVITKFKDRRSL